MGSNPVAPTKSKETWPLLAGAPFLDLLFLIVLDGQPDGVFIVFVFQKLSHRTKSLITPCFLCAARSGFNGNFVPKAKGVT